MKTSEILTEAKALIADSKHWTQGTEARDAFGRPCHPRWSAAVCFCGVGALECVIAGVRNPEGTSAATRAKAALREVTGMGVVRFNDNHPHAEVMEAWDKAIARSVAIGD